MIRKLDIPRLLFDLLRPEFSIRKDRDDLTDLYKFLGCCLAPLARREKTDWGPVYERNMALASCDGSLISVSAYLNKYFNKYGQITIESPIDHSVIMWPYSSAGTGAVTMYPYEGGGGHAVIMYNYGIALNSPIITIPAKLKRNRAMYSDFLADLSALTMYGIQFVVNVEG